MHKRALYSTNKQVLSHTIASKQAMYVTRPVARQDSSPNLALVNQIIRSEHLQDTLCVAKDSKRLQADSEDSDQHARI